MKKALRLFDSTREWKGRVGEETIDTMNETNK